MGARLGGRAAGADDDLDVEEGRIDELIGRIKKRTGQTEDAVRDALERG